jgi:GTP cyclohydrolase II
LADLKVKSIIMLTANSNRAGELKREGVNVSSVKLSATP